VRAENIRGWGKHSQLNLLGLTVFVEPFQMKPPTRGALTTESRLELYWEAIEADSEETGGSEILSYQLEWKELSVQNYKVLVGSETVPFLATTFT